MISRSSNPLEWPPGRHRTRARERRRALFRVTRYRALQELREELGRLKVDEARITLDLALRRADDLPLASAREPQDPGVAVYYTRRGRDHVLACDQFLAVGDNVAAIARTIGAQRGIVRWGCLSLDEAIAGSRLALPGEVSTARPWREVLGGAWPAELERAELLALAKARHRRLMADHHPDLGGDHAVAAELNAAIAEAERELEAPHAD